MTPTDTNQPSPSRRDWPWLAALVALIASLYLPQLVTRQTAMEPPAKMDVTSQWYPGYTATGRMYREATFPLWNPNLYAGMPWVAYSHAGVLYPPNVILFTALNFFDAVTLAHLLHALIAALGLYFLMREFELQPPAAFLAGLAFPITGFFFYLQSQLSNHAAIAWTPLLLLTLTRLFRRPRLITLVLAGTITALMVLAGDAEGFVYNTIFTTLFLVFVLRAESPLRFRHAAVIALAGLAIGLMVSAALIVPLAELQAFSIRSARALIPVEFSGLLKPLWLYLSFIPFPLRHYAAMHPGADFNSGLPPFHCGLVTLIAAAAALRLVRSDRRGRGFILTALLMTLFMVLKSIRSLEPILDRVPVIAKLATPERSLEFVQLMLIAAAAVFADHLLRRHSRRGLAIAAAALLIAGLVTAGLARYQVAPGTRAALAVAFIISASVLFRLSRLPSPTPRLLTAVIIVLVICDLYLPALVCVPRTSPDDFQLDPAAADFLAQNDPNYRHVAFQNIDPKTVAPAVTGVISAQTNSDSPFGHMRLPLARYFEFLHLIDPNVAKDWDEIFFGVKAKSKLFFTADLYNPTFLDYTNLHLLNLAAVRYVFAQDVPLRFSSPYSLMDENGFRDGRWEAKGGLPWGYRNQEGPPGFAFITTFIYEISLFVHPGAELDFELEHVPSDYSSTLDVEVWAGDSTATMDERTLIFSEQYKLVPGSNLPVRVPLDQVSGRKNRIQVIIRSPDGYAGAAIVDLRFSRPDAPLQRVAPGPIDIYENVKALPRAFVAHEAKVMGREELADFMRRPDRFDPGRMALFEEGEVPAELLELVERGRTVPGDDRVEMVSRKSQEVRMRTRLNAPGWLILSDAYHPGWRAFVNGAETRIYRSDYTFRSALVPDGPREIVFQYQPAAFRLGLWFALASIAAAALGLFIRGAIPI